jgi:hypothetical protein
MKKNLSPQAWEGGWFLPIPGDRVFATKSSGMHANIFVRGFTVRRFKDLWGEKFNISVLILAWSRT